jgi:Cu(I)/Ag(I) efflux system membrane protein CusA/SilA
MREPFLVRMIEFSMRRSARVILVFLALSLLGAWAAWRSPLDAIPDLSDPQVLLYARLPGSPEQIAEGVTAPVMKRLKALPGVRTVRGFSDLGYSYITVLLEPGGSMEAARARIRAEAAASTEASWSVAADASGVGWVYQYALSSPRGDLDLYELRALQETVLGPALAKLQGVSEVAPVGGYSRRFEIVANPRLLEARGLVPADLLRGLKRQQGALKGRVVMLSERDIILGYSGEAPASRAEGGAVLAVAESAAQLEALKIRVNGREIPLGDLARVRRAPDLRRGIADLDGQGEVVGGIVIAAKGVNALELAGRVKARLEQLKAGLPRGVDIVQTYDRSDLILAALRTVRTELLQELLLVALVIFVFLGHWRSMLVLSIALPVTIFLHFLPLHLAALSMNLMTLGGLAIAIGDIIDAGIVLVENGNRALAENAGATEQERFKALAASVALLIKPLFFTILVVVVSFLPVFALEGQEGRLFMPLAASKTLSMLSALAVTLWLVPALCARYLKGDFKREEEQPLGAWLQSLYRPSLERVLSFPRLSLGVNFSLLAVTVPLFLWLPREFLPPLNEGALLYMPVTASGVPAAQVGALMKEADLRLKAIPEVRRVFGKAGRAESATDPAPLSMIESTILLKPRGQWRRGMDEEKLVKEMDAALQFTGLSNGWTQPIRGRIDMQATGIRTPLGLKVFGPNLEAAEAAAVRLEEALTGMEGVRSAVAERAGRAPSLGIEVDEKAAAKEGLTKAQVLGQVLAHAGGAALAGEGDAQVAVLYPEEFTNHLGKMLEFPIFGAKGRSVPLGSLAKVELRDAPEMLGMENGQVVAVVYLDLKDRDTMGWVRRHQAQLPPQASLGEGVHYEFSGQYESDRRASRRLAWLVPLCLLIIIGLLAMAFGSLAEAWLVILSVPFALIGGVWIQWALGIPLSVSVWVGYIALFAVAVQTGVVMVVYLQETLAKRLAEGPLDEAALREVVLRGSVLRLRPKLMTVATNVIGFLPLLFIKGAGDDLLASVAAPLVGGMLTSAVHVLYITPILFLITKRRALRAGTLAPAKPSGYL